MPLKSSETNMGEQERFDDFNAFQGISMHFNAVSQLSLKVGSSTFVSSCHRVKKSNPMLGSSDPMGSQGDDPQHSQRQPLLCS